MSPAAAVPPTCFLVDSPREAFTEGDLRKWEPGTRGCALCGEPIGVVDRESATGGDALGWVAFYEVMAEGDDAPTRFCSDCFDWLQDIAAIL